MHKVYEDFRARCRLVSCNPILQWTLPKRFLPSSCTAVLHNSANQEKKAKKRRAVPKKRTKSIHNDVGKEPLEELEKAREPGDTRLAFAYRDPPQPLDILDAPLIDSFLLQEDWIGFQEF
jgi:hypothetical protein